MFAIRCPKCHRLGKVPDDKAGSQVRCTHCGEMFNATPATAVPPPAPLPPLPAADDPIPIAPPQSPLRVVVVTRRRPVMMIVWVLLALSTCITPLPAFLVPSSNAERTERLATAGAMLIASFVFVFALDRAGELDRGSR